jgi:hypothetical protein
MSQMFSASLVAIGTPQRLAGITVPAQASASGGLSGIIPPRGSCVIFQAAPANTATKFVYIGGPSLNVAAKTGIGMALLPGGFSPPIFVEGDCDLGDFWIDGDGANGDKLFVTVV